MALHAIMFFHIRPPGYVLVYIAYVCGVLQTIPISGVFFATAPDKPWTPARRRIWMTWVVFATLALVIGAVGLVAMFS